MRTIDLRSDTVTRPTPAMRRAMAEAEVGDDVFGEDPTINKLEEIAAERMGKEAALFVPSGTMANLVSLLTHCGRGDEVILGDQAHIYMFEAGGLAALGSIHPRAVRNQPDGTLSVNDIEAVIRPDDVHHPRTKMILLENTHNRCNGSPLSSDYMHRVREIADRHGLKIHVDGARIFNSAVAQGVAPRELVADADSVSFCLSKGLAAPVGSLICSTRDFVKQARRTRKSVGGGLRQAGILAAAGIVALDQMVDHLAEDHANARNLGEGLSDVPGLSIKKEYIKTNILFIGVEREDMTAKDLSARLKEHGIKINASAPRQLRAVTNYHVTSADIEYAVGAFKKEMSR